MKAVLLLLTGCFGSEEPPAEPASVVRKPVVEAPKPETTVPLREGDAEAGVTARCADGRVVFPFWQGEYPAPALQLNGPVRVKVRDEPCGDPTHGCLLKPGLYHPWASASDRPGELSFATLTRTRSFTLKVDHAVGGATRPAGTAVEVLTYLSEGMCRLRVSGQLVEDMCPGTESDADTVWSGLDDADPDRLQLIEVDCDDGTRGWMEGERPLLGRPEVVEANVTGFGEVQKR